MGIIEILILILILIIAWLGGFVLNIAGSLIHVLLVIAIIIIIYRLFRKSS